MDSFSPPMGRAGVPEQIDVPGRFAPLTDGSELRDFLQKLWRRKGLIFGTVALLAVTATVILFQITPRYSATSLVLVETRGANIVNLEAVLTGGVLPDEEAIESEMAVIGSRRLASKVVEKLNLDSDPEFNLNLQPPGLIASVFGLREFIPETWRNAIFGIDEEVPLSETELRAQERALVIDVFLSNLTLAREGKSRVISINFSSENPKTAANVANALADAYIVDQLEAKFERTRRETEWLSDKIAGLRQKAEASDKAVEQYRKQAGLLQGTGGSTLIQQQISELSAQHIIARAARAEAEAKLSQVQQLIRTSGGAASAAEVLQSPLITALVTQEAELNRRLAELGQQLGERHPRMINAKAELKDLQNKIATEVNRIVQGQQNEVGVARAREASLQQSLEQLKARVAQSNAAEVQLRALERESQADKTMLEQFLTRFQESSAQKDLGSQEADARVISRADVPIDPAFPQKGLFLAVVIVAATFLGVLLVFVVEQLDRGFRSGEQIERMTGAGVLALVPAISGILGSRQSPHAYILERPTSAFGESIRSLYTSLLLSHVDAPPKTVVFTSAHSHEGKTTLAVSLARMLAKSGRKVMIVDGDLRKPSVSRFLGMATEPGLVELLAGEIRPEEAIRRDEPSGLHVITAGKFASNAADILSSEQMKRLVDGLARTYDLVIIDSPPVLAVSDARILSTIVDRVVFAVRWADTRRESVASAMKQVIAAGGRLAGAVLTMVNVKKHAQYNFADSGYYYGRIKKYYAK